ncbi:hypothetical protein DMH12_02480 [Streptomyces sp. WAC 04229]|uniref:hypothetical protein n=1 Tax=Streptomyces sp. WAC 04229 TaxID=2203206 RepID=UPI000F73A000|nr:hypothetical protein [Streptomyces sp. WAC 04229]RSN64609.1 hypothetical protein DMH12_02480 [Streptomyces sp. WAC 04229]
MARTAVQYEADSLLHALDPLAHPARTRELVVRAGDSDDPRSLLAELETRGAHGRRLAVVAASAAGDTGWIADRIADPDPYVRGHALRVAGSLGVPDAAFETALADAPETTRRALLRAVVAGGRTALADRLVDGVRRDRGDTEATRLLPGCTPPTVARLLPGLLYAVRAWSPLAKRHRAALFDALERELTALPEAPRDTWWRRYAHPVALLAPAEPARVLRLLEEYGPSRLPHELLGALPAFAAADPRRTLRLLPTPAWTAVTGVHRLGRTVLYRLTRHDSPELVAYARILLPYGDLPRLLRALPPARRPALCEAVREGRGAGGAVLVDEPFLEVLPRPHAAREAREAAARARADGAGPFTILAAESFLPVAEVHDRLLAATGHQDADDRARAWRLLVRNAARSGDPAAVTAVLRDMARLANEQDPVRSAALRAAVTVPASLFTEEVADLLDRVATDAVAARDSSPETRRLLSTLALGILREHAAGGTRALVNWALRTLVRISGTTGGADLGRLDRTLRRGQEHQVFEALRPWIEAGAEKSDYGLVFALARAVGPRAAGMPELQDLLWQAVRYGDDTTARTAVGLWLEPPATRDERAARVLAHEPSAAVLAPVRDVLVRRRTDLLDPLLAETPPYGRFLTKGTRWSLPVGAHEVSRWVPRQQLALLRRCAARAADTGLPLHARATALTRAAAVPDGGADLLRRWTGSAEVVLAEAALAALAGTDRAAESLPELLAHAGGDRARVAVYAVTRASRQVRPSVLAGHLRDVLRAPDAKVTGRKEAVRLAAVRLPVPDAAALVAEVYARPGTHRDVRAACVAFTGGLLGHEEVWELLHDAAAGAPVLRAALLRALPMNLPEAHRARYAALVRDVAADPAADPATAILAFQALARWAPWSAEAPGVLAGAVTDLGNRGTWASAANALIGAASSAPHGLTGLLDALTTLAGTEDGEGSDAGETRDRPSRRRIEALVAGLETGGRRPEAVRPAALAAAELLSAYDAHMARAAVLAAHHVDLSAVPPRLDRVADLAGPDRPALAARVAGAVRERLEAREQPGDSAVLLAEARTLAEHGGHARGLMAVAVTGALGDREDWPAPWRATLRTLRRHPVPDVRDAALEETTAYE